MVTAADKLAAVRRELRLRHRVYPRLIERGRLTQAQADREIEVMTAIVSDYELAAAREQPKLL